MWKTKKFLASGCDLLQQWPCNHLGSEPGDGQALTLMLSLNCAFLIYKISLKYIYIHTYIQHFRLITDFIFVDSLTFILSFSLFLGEETTQKIKENVLNFKMNSLLGTKSIHITLLY